MNNAINNLKNKKNKLIIMKFKIKIFCKNKIKQ